MAKKTNPVPSHTCADCFHFCACHQWAISISTDVAPQCPVFEPVRYRTLAELDDLRQMHKGDLAPVVHARWEETNCNACGKSYMEYAEGCSYPAYCEGELYTPDFCPHCGAKMDEKEDER